MSASPSFYVYYHVDPRDGFPKYVGKGQDRRAWHSYSRNKKHQAWVAELKSLGLEPSILIGNSFSSEAEALHAEKCDISVFRNVGIKLVNIAPGGFGGNGKHCRKAIVCINTGDIYPAVKDAALAFMISPKRISGILKGHKKTYRGLTFKYLDEELNLAPQLVRSKKENRRKASTSIPVLCIENGVIYPSMKDAADKLNFHSSQLSQYFKGTVKSVKGLTFTKII